MPEIYTDLTAPTQVTFSLVLPFTSASAQNIVVAKTSLLQIFTTTTHETVQQPSGPSTSDSVTVDRRLQDAADPDDEQGEFAADLGAVQRSGLETVSKLVLVAEYPLYGSVAGMQRIKLLESRTGGGDALLLAFRDAKLSLLEWDPETASISTISLHSYEREEFLSPAVNEGLPATLVADPTSRCAVLKFAGDMLAILPFRRREDEDLELGGAAEDEDVQMADGDLDDDDWDPSAPIETTTKAAPALSTNGEKAPKKQVDGDAADSRPYNPSFVVSAAAALYEQIEHIISLTFLHEYREPTLGILYAPRRTWAGLLPMEQRRDPCAYIVTTLDLEQRASTPILSVTDLPYDTFKVIALTPAIGGSLLVGCNQIIHIDQAGKTTGVAVNSYARRSTQFGGLADQSDLALALEGSTLVELEGESGDLLLITKTGLGVIVGFKMDGRNVSGLKITKMAHHPTSLVGGRATTAISLGGRRLFVGCSEGDARILKWRRRAEKKKLAAAAGLQLDDEVLENADMDDVYNMMDDLEEDDLYGNSNADPNQRKDSIFANGSARRGSSSQNKGEYVFTTYDRLINTAPLRDITMGRPTVATEAQERQRGVIPELEIVAASGPTNTSEDAGLTVFRRSIAPTVVGRFDFPACKALWTVQARAAGAGGEEQLHSADSAFDRFLFVSKDEESQVFRVGDEFEEVRGTEFDAEGATVEVGAVGEGQRIVQVVGEYVRVYDCDLNLTQIVPMFDEETGEEGPAIEKARICDPFVMLLRVDGSVVVHKLDKSMELQAEDMGVVKNSKYFSGCVYEARPGTVLPSSDKDREADYILALLTTEGTLQLFDLDNLEKPLLVVEGFTSLQPLVLSEPSTSLGGTGRGTSATEDITEILLADLGDDVAKEPYLIVRSALDDITLYKLFLTPASTLRLTKVAQPTVSNSSSTSPPSPFRPMVVLPNVSSHTAVFVPGASPSFILKTAQSTPHLHALCGVPVRSLTSFHTASADRGFAYVDAHGVVRVALLPPGFSYSLSWSTRKIFLHESVRALTYFPAMDVYVVSAVSQKPFSIDEEDGSLPAPPSTDGTPEHQDASPPELHPTVESGSLAIVNPTTWSVVDRFPFAYNETALVVATLSLEVSEHTKARAPLVCAGTAILRGEDNSARGGVYVFEVIEVVPEVNRPETNRKLKLVAREEVKGVVSALTGVNGYLLAAQGQKIMVRGLKEDQSLLPVAFMDVGAWVQEVKTLGGMVLGGEAGGRGVWFAGFSEEPYKMTLFGKDTQPTEAVAAEFLPDGDRLFFVVADANAGLHVLQYDPEHPKSLSGQRLLRRALFHVGHEITSLMLLPSSTAPPPATSAHARTPSSPSASPPPSTSTPLSTQPPSLILVTTRTGLLGTLHALPESTYRRLNILSTQIINSEEHTAGLNPRAYRACGSGSRGFAGGEALRGVIDGGVLGRWTGLAVGRRKEVVGKSGGEVQGVRGDWKVLGAGAVAYF